MKRGGWTAYSQIHHGCAAGVRPSPFFCSFPVVLVKAACDKEGWGRRAKQPTFCYQGLRGSTYQSWVYQLPGTNIPWKLYSKLRPVTDSPAEAIDGNWSQLTPARRSREIQWTRLLVSPQLASCWDPLRKVPTTCPGSVIRKSGKTQRLYLIHGKNKNKQKTNLRASLLRVHGLANDVWKQIMTTQHRKWSCRGISTSSNVTNEVVINSGGRRKGSWETSQEYMLMKAAVYGYRLREGHSRQRETQGNYAGTLIITKPKKVWKE